MRLLSTSDLKEKGVPFGETQRRRLISLGLFPKPVQIGLRKIAWVESEIDEWIRQRIANRDGEAA
jgi:prophage regulatory protein